MGIRARPVPHSATNAPASLSRDGFGLVFTEDVGSAHLSQTLPSRADDEDRDVDLHASG